MPLLPVMLHPGHLSHHHQIHGCVCRAKLNMATSHHTMLHLQCQIIFVSVRCHPTLHWDAICGILHLVHPLCLNHTMQCSNKYTTPCSIKRETYVNPFFVRFIVGNIRVCQGCRGNLRLSDRSVPSPPNNLVAARLEKRPYFDKVNGTWCYPQKETHSHYHLKLSCVVKAEPLFVPSTLQVPTEVFPDLLQVHFELLATEFGLNFNM